MKVRGALLGLALLVGCKDDSLCGNSDYASLCPDGYPPEPYYDASTADAGVRLDAGGASMDASQMDASVDGALQDAAGDASH